jgi:hypothetical protein
VNYLTSVLHGIWAFQIKTYKIEHFYCSFETTIMDTATTSLALKKASWQLTALGIRMQRTRMNRHQYAECKAKIDAARIVYNNAMADHKAALEEEARIQVERKVLEVERKVLEVERKALEVERKALEVERKALEVERNALKLNEFKRFINFPF